MFPLIQNQSERVRFKMFPYEKFGSPLFPAKLHLNFLQNLIEFAADFDVILKLAVA